jgi:hypothetical protein
MDRIHVAFNLLYNDTEPGVLSCGSGLFRFFPELGMALNTAHFSFYTFPVARFGDVLVTTDTIQAAMDAMFKSFCSNMKVAFLAGFIFPRKSVPAVTP